MTAAPTRTRDPRAAARWMAGFALLGAAMGSVNLVVAGVLREGAPRATYAATMALLAVLGLTLLLRPRAVVRPTDVLARIVGEELVVVGLAADSTEAHRLGERLRGAVRQAAHPGVTASIGIALERADPDVDAAAGVWRLVDRADAAMYEATQAGRDRVELAPPLVPTPRLRAAHPVVRSDHPA